MSPKLQLAMLKVWHAWLAGGYLVAYVTGDEDTYAMHLFAGYAVLAAVAVRLVVGAFISSGPLRLPRPSLRAAWAWVSTRKGRHPLFAVFAAALLVIIGLSALTGAAADFATWMEDPHEALSEASLWVVFGHIGFVVFIYGGKRLWNRVTGWLADSRLMAKVREQPR